MHEIVETKFMCQIVKNQVHVIKLKYSGICIEWYSFLLLWLLELENEQVFFFLMCLGVGASIKINYTSRRPRWCTKI